MVRGYGEIIRLRGAVVCGCGLVPSLLALVAVHVKCNKKQDNTTGDGESCFADIEICEDLATTQREK